MRAVHVCWRFGRAGPPASLSSVVGQRPARCEAKASPPVFGKGEHADILGRPLRRAFNWHLAGAQSAARVGSPAKVHSSPGKHSNYKPLCSIHHTHERWPSGSVQALRELAGFQVPRISLPRCLSRDRHRWLGESISRHARPQPWCDGPARTRRPKGLIPHELPADEHSNELGRCPTGA